MTRVSVCSFVVVLLGGGSMVPAPAQQFPGGASPVPALVRYNGLLAGVDGNVIHGVAGVTFSFYKDAEGGAPLWMETHNVQTDEGGNYVVMLGSATKGGLPAELFSSGEARWLGIQPQGQPEQPRILVSSVPYSLKAIDADTVGGLPASAFVRALPLANGSGSSPAESTSAVATPALAGSGTLDFIPLWTPDGNTLGNSILFQSSTSNIGVGTQTPAAKLDVNGAATVRGLLSLPSFGVATATTGANSDPLSLTASSFSSTSQAAVNEAFRWRAEPVGNNTATPSATLNLLFASGTSTPAETGFKISSTGLVAFATGQRFPGTGTITGVTAGAGLTGGGSTGSVTLSLLKTCSSGQVLAWNGTTWACANPAAGTITGVTAGTDLTGGGTSGTVTLNLDTTKVPQLNSSNIFTATQTFNGVLALPVTTSATQGMFTVAGLPFLHTLGGYTNTFVGANAGGLLSSTVGANTAVGYAALYKNTTGGNNTALGIQSLYSNTVGVENIAIGYDSLGSNTSGAGNIGIGSSAVFGNLSGSSNIGVGSSSLSYTTGSGNIAIGFYGGYYNKTGANNTFLGYYAGPDQNSPGLSYATAIGANATVSESNALVLGGTGPYAVRVGIGVPAPQHTLDVNGDANFSGGVNFAGAQTIQVPVSSNLGPTLTLSNPAGGTNAAASLDFNTFSPAPGTYNPSARIEAIDQGNFANDIVFYANNPGSANNGLSPIFRVSSTGGVTATPLGNGGDGGIFYGADASSSSSLAGTGVLGLGGNGGYTTGAVGGIGGYFAGGVQGSQSAEGIYATGVSTAGSFNGDVQVAGTLYATAKNFRIDHPLDPANKYLDHASVESSEMKNIYDGVAVLDAGGEAVVQLPEWFEALNKDFCYQLTAIGVPGPNLYIAQEVLGNSFRIGGGKPGMKVSWQVTGIRQDEYAKAHPLQVSVDKSERERGYYIHPELYGQPEEKQIEWSRHSEVMQKIKQFRTRQTHSAK